MVICTPLKCFGQNFPRYVGSLDDQMPHRLALQKAPNPLPTSDYTKIFPRVKLFIQMEGIRMYVLSDTIDHRTLT